MFSELRGGVNKFKKKSKGAAGHSGTHNLIPAVPGQRQEDLCEFEVTLVYIASFRPASVT